MGHSITLSDQAYATLEQVARDTGQTPEALVESLIAEASQKPRVFTDLDDFFRSVGATEEDIRASERLFEEREQARQAQEKAPDDADL